MKTTLGFQDLSFTDRIPGIRRAAEDVKLNRCTSVWETGSHYLGWHACPFKVRGRGGECNPSQREQNIHSSPNMQQMHPLSFVTWLGCKQDGHSRENRLNFLFLFFPRPRYISVQLSGGQLCLL